MSKKRSASESIVFAGLVLIASAASAQEVKGSGTHMFVPKLVESFALADGTTSNRMTWSGFMTADDPTSPLRQSSMYCSGTAILTKDNKPVRAAGTCDAVDLQGDVVFYWWRQDDNRNGGKWGYLGGSGKWANVEGGGTWEQTQTWKDGRIANSWKGTWKTK